MKCLSCGKKWQLDGLERFCPYCGKSLHYEIQSVECPVCGTTSQVNSLCGSCGFDFSSCMEMYDTFALPLKTIRSIAAGRYGFEATFGKRSDPKDRFTVNAETPHTHDWADSKADTTHCRLCGVSRHRLSATKFSYTSANSWDVQEIQFLRMDLQNVPESAWDVSAVGNRSILAWVEEDMLIVASDGVIAVGENAEWMFSAFKEVQSIHFNNCFDTSDVTDMHDFFSGCSNLAQVDLSDLDTSKVKNMCEMFYGCSNLTHLDISGMNTSVAADMSAMFSGCSGLTKLDLSQFDTSAVQDMSAMFSGCSSLTQLEVYRFATYRVTNMGSMFDGCSSLTHLDLSGFITSNVISMVSMFDGCSSLKQLDLSDFDISNVTDMSDMFQGCRSLTMDGLICTDSRIRSEYSRHH